MAIANWLKSKHPYAVGYALWKEHGASDEDLGFLLAIGETSVSRSALVNALEDLLAAAVDHSMRANTETPAPPLVTKAAIVAEREAMARSPQHDGFGDVDLPAPLRSVHDQVKIDLRERDYHRHRLETLPTDAERLRGALIIVELDAAIGRAYRRLDTWKETGKDPDANNVHTRVDPFGIARELKNIATYISRHRSGARSLSPEKLQRYQARQLELEALVAEHSNKS